MVLELTDDRRRQAPLAVALLAPVASLATEFPVRAARLRRRNILIALAAAAAVSLATPLVRHRYPQVAEVLAAGLEVNDGTMPLEPPVILSQYTLEPLLREAAEATPGVTVRFGAELIDFAAAGSGVTATVHTSSRLRTLRADYLVGCDGADSTVRAMLGVELRGQTRQPERQALIYCPDLYERLPAGRAIQYHIVGELPCTLIVQDDAQHFTLHAPQAGPSGPPLATLFEAVAGQHVRNGYKIVCEGEWAQDLLLAEHYCGAGRVFLAGDAAHPASTTGGLGMSIAVADAADLAWKLAGTLQGWGGPALLRSYETERRPVAAQAITASLAAAEAERRWRAEWRSDILHDTPSGARSRLRLIQAAAEERWYADLTEIEHGYRYTASPVLATVAGTSASAAAATWPGARLPHLWLDDGRPLHDLLGTGFTLLRLPGAADKGAREYARELAGAFGRRGVPFDMLEVSAAAAQVVYAGHRLILVRPDLHVAWRSGDSQPDAAALAALVTGNLRESPPARLPARLGAAARALGCGLARSPESRVTAATTRGRRGRHSRRRPPRRSTCARRPSGRRAASAGTRTRR